MPRLLVETGLVLVTGLALGLASNALSSDGLELGRDYFPKGAATARPVSDPVAEPVPEPVPEPGSESAAEPVSDSAAGDPTPPDASPAPPPATDGLTGAAPPDVGSPPDDAVDPAVVERLAAKGLRAATFSEVRALHEDPMYAYEAYVFIDARDDDHYADGHIPGARQFDHFHPERHQEALLQVLPTAMEIIVYCNGGDCEDSESAALFLMGMGADPQRLRVYAGGITEWRARGMPVERGARNSGDLEESTP